MNIVVTGSLGNISKPLTIDLVQKGHSVTVISSNPAKQKDIEALGAKAAIGTLADVGFLTATFSHADVVYCMTPPNYTAPDMLAYYRKTGDDYAQAIHQAGVKRVIYLSSYGAHLDKGTGLILGSHHVEERLNALPDTDVTHMRPTYFYYNLYAFVDMIKAAGVMAANYGGDDKIVMVSPKDIAAAIAEEIDAPTAGRHVRYVASDERTGNEIARVLGAAIGKPELQWDVITDEAMKAGLEAHGVPVHIAAPMVEMLAGIHNGTLAADYYRSGAALTGKVKLEDFAQDFAAAFQEK